MKQLCLILIALSFVTVGEAQDSQSLKDLLDEVSASAKEEAKINQAREKKFREQAENQVALMRQAEADVQQQEAQRDDLRKRFDENEAVLSELQDLLQRRSGDLGELFGVFRQSADDTEAIIFDSLISLQYPERKQQVAALAESTEVPTIDQIRGLWQLLIHEIAESSEVSKFNHSVIDPDGSAYQAEVVRIGDFNVVSNDKYLRYLSENGSLEELARQPEGAATASAAKISTAAPGERVDFTIDPSRGALLGLLVQSPSFAERIEQGGTVGYAIIAVGIAGLLLVFERLLKLMRVRSRMNRQLKNMEEVYNDNPIGHVMQVYYEYKHLDLETISRKLQEVLIRDMAEVKKGLPIVKVLAAVAPLMGLLGTVVGMIGTFQAITLFGTGDPKLMAGGISQALITTVLGLCAAIPLLLCHSLLSSRVTMMSKIIGEQAAGLMAKKAESDAQGA